MLRIVVVESEDGSVTLRLAGRLIGPWVAELGQASDRALARGGRVVLDLAQVSFIDRQGIALVGSLRERGAGLRDCSPFVREQLREVLRPAGRP
jgi:hypothetical protein